jgi:hypothetical protein
MNGIGKYFEVVIEYWRKHTRKKSEAKNMADFKPLP